MVNSGIDISDHTFANFMVCCDYAESAEYIMKYWNWFQVKTIKNVFKMCFQKEHNIEPSMLTYTAAVHALLEKGIYKLIIEIKVNRRLG